MDDDVTLYPKDVECPVCGAAVGEPCSQRGFLVPVHGGRIRAVQAAYEAGLVMANR